MAPSEQRGSHEEDPIQRRANGTILREADTKPVPDVAKKHGVSTQTIYGWRKHFGRLERSDVRRLRQLEQENGRLKKMVADRDLEIDVLKEITRKNGGRTRAPAAGRVYPITRSVRPPRVRRALGGAVDRGLPIAAGGAGCPGSDRDASFGGPVPALRVSSDPDLPETRGARDEHRSHASALAPGGVAGPAAAPSAPGGHGALLHEYPLRVGRRGPHFSGPSAGATLRR